MSLTYSNKLHCTCPYSWLYLFKALFTSKNIHRLKEFTLSRYIAIFILKFFQHSPMSVTSRFFMRVQIHVNLIILYCQVGHTLNAHIKMAAGTKLVKLNCDMVIFNKFSKNLPIFFDGAFTAWKLSKYGVSSGPYFPVSSLYAGKYGPEKTPYLNFFQTVISVKIVNSIRQNASS